MHRQSSLDDFPLDFALIDVKSIYITVLLEADYIIKTDINQQQHCAHEAGESKP